MTSIDSFFANKMITLGSLQNHELVEVMTNGDIHRVGFLGKIWRKIQVIFGFGHGFTDCKLQNIAQRLDALIQKHWNEFYELPQEVRSSALVTLAHLKEHTRDKQASQIFGILTASLGCDKDQGSQRFEESHAVLRILENICDDLISYSIKKLILGLETAIVKEDVQAAEILSKEILKRISQDPPNMPSETIISSRAFYQLLLIVYYMSSDAELLETIINFLNDKKPLFSDDGDMCKATGTGLGSVQDLIDRIQLGPIFGRCVNKNFGTLLAGGYIQLSQMQEKVWELAIDAYRSGMISIANHAYAALFPEGRRIVATAILKEKPSNTCSEEGLRAYSEKFINANHDFQQEVIRRIGVDYERQIDNTKRIYSVVNKELGQKVIARLGKAHKDCLERIKTLGISTNR